MKATNYKIMEVYKTSGTSQRTGEPWSSTEILVSNNDEMIENRMLVRLTQKCAECFNLKKGDIVDLDIIHDTREYNGSFYNRISAWRVTASQLPKGENSNEAEPF